MRCAIFSCLCAIVACLPVAAGEDLSSHIVGDSRSGPVMHAVRYAPAPRLPDAAIRQRLTGTGVYAIDVDAGGQIGDVRVVRSAGHKILDDAAVEALRKWIFRPRTVYKLTLSITFTGDSTTVGRPQ